MDVYVYTLCSKPFCVFAQWKNLRAASDLGITFSTRHTMAGVNWTYKMPTRNCMYHDRYTLKFGGQYRHKHKHMRSTYA